MRAGRVVVAIDEARDDRHALGVDGLRLACPASALMSAVLPTAMNRPPLIAKACAVGFRLVDRVDLGIDHDQIRFARIGLGEGGPRRPDQSGGRGRAHEISSCGGFSLIIALL